MGAFNVKIQTVQRQGSIRDVQIFSATECLRPEESSVELGAWTVHNVTREHRAPLMGWHGHNWCFSFLQSSCTISPQLLSPLALQRGSIDMMGMYIYIRPSLSTNKHAFKIFGSIIIGPDIWDCGRLMCSGAFDHQNS